LRVIDSYSTGAMLAAPADACDCAEQLSFRSAEAKRSVALSPDCNWQTTLDQVKVPQIDTSTVSRNYAKTIAGRGVWTTKRQTVREFLSPVRLPVSPSGHKSQTIDAEGYCTFAALVISLPFPYNSDCSGRPDRELQARHARRLANLNNLSNYRALVSEKTITNHFHKGVSNSDRSCGGAAGEQLRLQSFRPPGVRPSQRKNRCFNGHAFRSFRRPRT
jgi:hypothetical protein